MCLALIRLTVCLLIPGASSVKTLSKVTSEPQRTVIVPCMYDERYQNNSKYLCKGFTWPTCNPEPRIGGAKENVKVTDYPAQNIFTVAMINVGPEDSGYYWCAVKIGDFWTPDDKKYFYLSVTEEPDLSVRRRSLSTGIGGNVSVQCRYSNNYRGKTKKWCRFQDQECSEAGGPVTAAGQVIDDGAETLSVVMVGVTDRDTGWYWCEAGGLQVPVYLHVTQETDGQQANSSSTPPTSDLEEEVWPADRKEAWIALSVTFGVLLVLAVVGTVAWRERNKQMKRDMTSTPQNQGRGDGQRLRDDKACSEIEYNSVVFKKGNRESSPQQLRCPPEEDLHIIYSTVKSN